VPPTTAVAPPDTDIQTSMESTDLTVPSNAIQATPDALYAMSDEDKALLKSRLTDEQISLFSDWQRADLDVFDVEIPSRGDLDAPLSSARGRVFAKLGDRTVHIDSEPADRFYCVGTGIGFTGVVRGFAEFDCVCPQGTKGARSTRGGRRDQAERDWRRLLYTGSAGILPPPVKQPELVYMPKPTRRLNM
jgi:hypothetical protein